MKRRTLSDCTAYQGWAVPAGSVIDVKRTFKHCARGIWCSMWGSHTVTVPLGAFAESARVSIVNGRASFSPQRSV